MKYLIVLIYTLVCISSPQEKVLKGRYNILYDKKHISENGTITFKETSYTRKTTSGKKVKGTIEHENRLVVLKDEKSDLRIKIFKSELDKDTISFGTFDAGTPKGDIVIFTGKLIKIN